MVKKTQTKRKPSEWNMLVKRVKDSNPQLSFGEVLKVASNIKNQGGMRGGEFWEDFGDGFVKGFTGSMKVAMPIIKAVSGLGKKKQPSEWNILVKQVKDANPHLAFSEVLKLASQIYKGKKSAGNLSNYDYSYENANQQYRNTNQYDRYEGGDLWGDIKEAPGRAWNWAKENPGTATALSLGALGTYNLGDYMYDTYFDN